MRSYPPSFAYANEASEKYPHMVAAIVFPEGSLYFTSHAGIPNVPGIVIDGVLNVRQARSQRIVPDEGRSENGAVSFELVDLDHACTDAFRDKHVDAKGLRKRKVVLYHGFAGADFTQYQVFQTQVVQSATYERGAYSVSCADITREQRKDVFDPKSTRLTASISDSATTIPVVSTLEFALVAHGPSFADAPNATVGYIQIEQERIRYTGRTDTTFTGCTRGALNTRPAVHAVDANVPQDRRTEVREVIYLELPAPKLALAIMTGELYGQASHIPAHWHMGISPEWIRAEDFTGIGSDLWNLAAENVSFVPRFLGLKKTDGKRFLEAEVYQLMGCYPIVYADGRIGLRRMNRVLADAPFVAVLDASNVASWSGITFDMEAVANNLQIEWNFDQEDNPTRTTRLVDGDSIAMHQSAAQKVMRLRGLYGSRHTDGTVRARLDAWRDRYAHPPQRQRVVAMPRMNVLEVGDIVRNRLPLVRDYMGDGPAIDRSMEVQSTRINPMTGEVDLELFGSTGLSTTLPWTGGGGQGPGGENNAPDDLYEPDPEDPDPPPPFGTALNTVVGMSLVGDVWVTEPGTFALPGNANATSAAAVYYHDGDLTIHAGTVLAITQNVQLRIRGFLTINGQISGVGGGHPGVADPAGYGTTAVGTPGFGSSRAMNGTSWSVRGSGPTMQLTFLNLDVPTTTGTLRQVPVYEVWIQPGNPPVLQGLPTDLRGTSGGPGGKFARAHSSAVVAPGGTGGAGGAGLIIISRGLAVSPGGVINLSGAASGTPSSVSSGGIAGGTYRPGAGAPGCPGALLVLVDGNGLSMPDLSAGRFLARTGASGAPRTNTMTTASGGRNPWTESAEREGYLDPATTDSVDLSNSAYRIQYLPAIQTPVEDQPPGVPAPSGLAATGVANGVVVSFSAAMDQVDYTEVWAAPSNDRSGAVQIVAANINSYYHALPASTTRYYWARSRRAGVYSDWEPSSPTGGVSGTST